MREMLSKGMRRPGRVFFVVVAGLVRVLGVVAPFGVVCCFDIVAALAVLFRLVLDPVAVFMCWSSRSWVRVLFCSCS